MRFSEWKKKTMFKLIKLASSASNEKERSDLSALINTLHTLRYRDLPSFLRLLWAYCEYHKKYEVCSELVPEDIESD